MNKSDQEMVIKLDNNLRHFSKIVKRELGKNIDSISGGRL